MTTTTLRAARGLSVLAALALLAGCSTTVTGSGHRVAAGGFPQGSSSSPSGSGSGSSSGSGSGSGSISASGDPHDVWQSAIDASEPSDGTVAVTGTISGAGVSGAKITASYSVDDDGDDVAKATVVTDKGSLDILATGGKAWAKSTAAVYVEYGYDAAASQQADGKQVVITDDDSGLDVYTAFTTFLSLCGPDTSDPASLDDGTYQGKKVVVVNDDKYGTKSYVDPGTGHVLASVYKDETVTFSYSDDATKVDPPAAADVVTVDGF